MSENDAQPDPSGPELPPDIREITDARTLRALSHPVRLALIEELTIGGAMTATELGERIGESPTTCSFHLRQLAKYGFVEEAGGGKGRARPWQMTSIGMSFGDSHNNDPEYEIASRTLALMFRERSFERYRTWMETKASYPVRWRDAAENNEAVFYVTAEELEQLNRDVTALLMSRYLDRITDKSKRPPGSVPVEVLVMTWPLRLPGSDDEPGDDHEPGDDD
ncbi:MAG: winged helix-turn-helix domain-containing protein [Streptosporangiaceae bacterium]